MKIATIANCLDAKVEYEFFRDGKKLPEEMVLSDYEHVQGLIRDGYREGELVHETCQGWWKLK